MATYLTFPVPTSPTSATLFSATLATVTATAQLIVGAKTIIGITAAGTAGANASINVRFGNATRSQAATANDWFVPAGTVAFFDTGSEFDRVSLFNQAGTSVTYYIYCFSRI